MSIIYNEKERAFKLRAKDTDYMLKVIEGEYLGHVYYGKADEEYKRVNELIKSGVLK